MKNKRIKHIFIQSNGQLGNTIILNFIFEMAKNVFLVSSAYVQEIYVQEIYVT